MKRRSYEKYKYCIPNISANGYVKNKTDDNEITCADKCAPG